MLGRGAMGVIYQAYDPEIDRRVALKLIRADLLEGEEKQEFIARFRREAQAAGRCVHANIVAIYDLAMHGDNPFLAMELVDGVSLAAVLRERGRLPIDEAVAIMLQVLDALECAHRIGVVHRDIKPANILLTPDKRVKITDFGIARFESSELTQHGAMIGTPSYMSPEQVSGAAIDGRSDLFSAAAVLFEMLAGIKPFSGKNAAEVTFRLVTQDAPALDSVVSGVPSTIVVAVRRALARQPEHRFATAKEMAQALRAPATTPGPVPAADATVISARSASLISPTEQDRAAEALAQHLGPIARVLVKRAAARVTTVTALWDQLAAEIPSAADRAAFLRQRDARGARPRL